MEKTKLIKLILPIFILTGLFIQKSFALQATSKQIEFLPGEIIVKFRSTFPPQLSGQISMSATVGSSSLDSLNRKHGVISIGKIFKDTKAPSKVGISQLADDSAAKAPDSSRWYKLKVSKDADLKAIVRDYQQDPNVEYAGLNVKPVLFYLPDDEHFDQQWSLHNTGQAYLGVKHNNGCNNDEQVLKTGIVDSDIDAPEAWDLAVGSVNPVIVAVIDTGLDYNHPDIADNVWINPGEIPDNGIDDDNNGYIDDIYGFNFGDSVDDNNDGDYNDPEDINDSDPMDIHGHGTHCSGTISAIRDNGIGVAGVSGGAKIMAVKIFGYYGGEAEDAKAIRYAVDNGARILSNSWGYFLGYNSQIVQEAINYAYSKNCVVIFAVGNDNSSMPFYPAADENVIAVSATDSSDQKADFSNFGSWIDLAAPGVDILSLRAEGTDSDCEPNVHIVDDYYYINSGTSMACPHVAGLAALILSQHPEFSNEEIKQVLRTLADDISPPGWDMYSGYGRINAYNALQIDSVCTANIESPKIVWANKGETLPIIGTANGVNFQDYVVEYGEGITPAQWTLLNSSNIPIDSGTLAQLETDELRGTYTIRLTVHDTNGREFRDRILSNVYRIPEQLEGWPVNTKKYTYTSSPTIADIDHNGRKDILIADRDSIYAYNFEGNSILNINVGEAVNRFAVSAAELDPDYPGEEFAIVQKTSNGAYLHLYHADGTEITNGGAWPKPLPPIESEGKYRILTLTATIIADIDNDKEFEIIQPTVEYIYAWNLDGSPVAGQWPQQVERYSRGLSVGNIDNDPELEIVIAVGNNTGDYSGKVYVFNHDGSLVSGWPLSFEQLSSEIGLCYTETILADIDNDTLEEIIFHAPGKGIYAINGDGTVVDGWPVSVGEDSASLPTATDIDQDGDIEVIIVTDKIYVINHDGSIVAGWPRHLDLVGADPVTGDIDGDGELEIVLISYLKPHVFVFRHDGTLIGKWPIPNETFVFASPALVDLDNDGDMEVVVVSDWGTIYVYDCEGVNPNGVLAPWPMFRNDARHTGCYSANKPMITSLVPSSGNLYATVAIHGENFGPTQCTSKVTFNEVLATEIISWSDTEIKVKVPKSATTGPVVVTTSAGSSNADKIFTVVPAVGQYLLTDITRDKIVNIFDLATVGLGFGKTGNIKADVNGDLVVDIDDLRLIGRDYGKRALLITDINQDGKVDIIDRTTVEENIGMSPCSEPRADVNGDGQIDMSDLELVGIDYGRTTDDIKLLLLNTDLNRDFNVDNLDLSIVQLDFGSSPPTDPRADVNGDGRINEYDLNLVRRDISPELNQPPVIDKIQDQVMNEGEELRIVINAYDLDNEPIHFLLPNMPQFAETTGYEDHAEIIFKPSYNDAGVYEDITVGVEDQAGLTDSTSFSLTVKDVVVDPPTVSLSVNSTTVGADEPFTLTLSGESTVGLASVWWFIVDKNNPSSRDIPGTVDGVSRNLAPAQDFGAGYGMTSYTCTRTITIDLPGEYEIKANARDILYGVVLGEPHQASEGAGMAVIPVSVEVVDTTKPTVSISIAPENSTKANEITFTATASDDQALGSVYININGETVIGSYTSPVAYTGGPYNAGETIRYFAGAYDKAGNYNSTERKEVYINGPDLTIHDIYDDQNKISIKIGNIGTTEVPAGTGHLYIWIDDRLEWTYSLSTLYNQSFRLPGGTIVVQPQVLWGQHKIRAEIDPNDLIDETDEENNTMEKTVYFKVGPPTVSLNANPATVTAGEPFTLTVSGSAPAGLASVWWWVEPSWPIPGTVDGIPRNLAPAQNFGAGHGETSYTYTRTVTITEPGDYEIKANARDKLYPIPGEPHQASEGAGLAVVSVNVEPRLITYYPSGNIKSFTTREGYKYVYMDENYYQPQEEAGQGRLMSYEHLNGYSRTLEYHGSSSRWIKTIIVGDEVMTFFKEDYFLNRRVIEDSDGNIIEVAPVVNKENFNFNCYVIKRDAEGNVCEGWPKTYEEMSNCQVMAVTVDSNNNVIVTYTINEDGVILKYGPDGDLLWSDSVISEEHNHLLSVVTDSQDNIIVVGWRGNYSQYDFLAIKYDLSGNLLWQKRYDIEDIDFLHDVYIDKNDDITVIGTCFNKTEGDQYHYALNLNSVTGDIIGEGATWKGQYEIDSEIGGCVAGRQYEHVYRLNSEFPLVTEFAYAYYNYISLIELQEGIPLLGDMLMFSYVETSPEVKIYGMDNIKRNGIRFEFSNEESPIEVLEVVDVDYPIKDEWQCTKATYRNKDTAWFLWGENVFEIDETLYSNVVIEHRGADDTWYAYTFTPSKNIMEVMRIPLDSDNWEGIGPIPQPDKSILPELGEWWQYCADNDIVPEFPPLSSDYTYDGLDRVIERIDHNPYMDTTNTYEWDTPWRGRMRMNISYDYDGDGDSNLIYSAVYENGSDYDIDNKANWDIKGQITYYPSGNIRTFTDNDGRIYSYMDENFYQTYPGHGRFMAFKHPDGYFREIEYYGNFTDKIKTVTGYNHEIEPGMESTETFYDEVYFNNAKSAVDSEGNVVMVAWIVDVENLNHDDIVIKMDREGNICPGWPRFYGEEWGTEITSVAVDLDDNVIVTGHVEGDWVTVKYDTNGQDVWPAPVVYMLGDGTPLCIATDFENNIIITGGTRDEAPAEFFTVKYDSDGNYLWHQTLGIENYYCSGRDIWIDENNNITIMGAYTSEDGNDDYRYAINYDPNGNITGQSIANSRVNSACWYTGGSVGREYKYTGPGMGVTDTMYLVGYYKYVPLIEKHEYLLPSFGGGTIYAFLEFSSEVKLYGEDLITIANQRIEFDNGAVFEIDLVNNRYNPVEGIVLTKAITPSGNDGYDTSWFLWGEDIFEIDGQLYDNVVVRKTAEGTWLAYHGFNPDTQNPLNVLEESDWVYLGAIPTPDESILPELGDWWQYCANNDIVPEFPPLSSDYTYDDLDRVTERLDHNPYMDTTNTYEWDTPQTGQLRMNISYDYDRDGELNFIYSAVYENGTDYDLSHMDQWPVVSETYGLKNRPPVLGPIGDKTVNEGQRLEFLVSASDPDGDHLADLWAEDLPTGAEFKHLMRIQVYPNPHIAGVFSWTPDYTQAGTYQVTFAVSDEELTTSKEVLIQVNNLVVPPPTVSLSVNSATVTAGEPFTLTVSGSSSVGLASVWWFVVDKDNPSSRDIPGTVDGVSRNLAPAQNFGAGCGMTSYTCTRTVTITEPGDYEIKANSRDILYPIPGEPHQASEGQGLAAILVNVKPLSFTVNAQDANGDELTAETISEPVERNILSPIPEESQQVSEETETAIIPLDVSPQFESMGSQTVNEGESTENLSDASSRIEEEFSQNPNYSRAGAYPLPFCAADTRGDEASSEPVETIANEANQVPQMPYVYNLWNCWLIWLSRDKEDGYRVRYSYRVDEEGEWSKPSFRRWITIRYLQGKLNLVPGEHTFEIKAIDKEGLESEAKAKFLLDSKPVF